MVEQQLQQLISQGYVVLLKGHNNLLRIEAWIPDNDGDGKPEEVALHDVIEFNTLSNTLTDLLEKK